MVRAQTTDIVAEMVANVIEVSVAVDDEVVVGDPVLMLESMKMEIPVLAEHAGKVTQVRVTAGDVVQAGDIMLTLTL